MNQITEKRKISLCKSKKIDDDCFIMIIDKRNDPKKPIIIEIEDSKDDNVSVEIKSSNNKRKFSFDEKNVNKKRKLNERKINEKLSHKNLTTEDYYHLSIEFLKLNPINQGYDVNYYCKDCKPK